MSVFALPSFLRFPLVFLLAPGLTDSSLFAQVEGSAASPSSEIPPDPRAPAPVAASQATDATAKQNTEKTAAYIEKWKEAVEKTKRLECSMDITNVDKVFNQKTKSSATYQFLKIKQQTETKSYRHLELNSGRSGNTISRRLINENIYTINNSSKCIGITDYSKITDNKKKEMSSEFFPSIILASIEEPVEISDFISNPKRILKRQTLYLEKDDIYYLYFSLRPNSKDGRSASLRGQLVLSKDTFLVRRIWWGGDNDEVSYDFTRMSLTPELQLSDFAALDREKFKGWTFYEMEYD